MPRGGDIMNIYVKIGGNIKKARKQKGLTAKQLAEGVARSRSFISDVENGRSKISIDLLHRIAIFLDVPIYRLTGEPETDFEKHTTSENIMELKDSLKIIEDNLSRDGVKWTFEGRDIPKDKVSEIRDQLKLIIELKQLELKKRQSKS